MLPVYDDNGLCEALFKALDSLDIGGCLVDEAGIIAYANSRYAAFFAAPMEAVAGKPFTDLLDQEDRESALAFHRETLRNSAPRSRRRSFKRADGGWVELAAVSVPWRGTGGEPLRVTVALDRREYTEAQERLRRIASIPLRNPNPIVELDRSGKPLFVNDSCAALFTGIEVQGAEHPYLKGIDLAVSEGTLPPKEIRIGDRWFQQIVHVDSPDRIRVYGFDVTERKRTELRLAESEARLRSILDNSRQAFVLLDREGKVRLFNRRAEELAEFLTSDGISLGADIADIAALLRIEGIEGFKTRFGRAIAGETQRTNRTFEVSGLGERMSFDVDYVPIRDEEGRTFAVSLVASDVTDRMIHEEHQALTAMVFDNAQEGILVTDGQARVLSVNKAFCRISGYSEEEFLGQNPRMLQSGWHGKDFYDRMWETIRRDGSWQGEIWDRRKDGTLYAQWSSITAVADAEGAVKYYVAIVNEITEQKEAVKRIRHMAYYDSLTDLPNRTLLFDRLAHSFDAARRDGGRIALLYVDLDRFKYINDGFGHEGGDRVLRETARRIRSIMRSSDTVARLGADEFIILIERLPDPQDAAQVAEKVLDQLAEPFKLGDMEVICGASIGIAVSPEDGPDFEQLLKNADAAMTRVKRAERIGFRFYRPEMNEQALERLRMESRLRRAESESALSVNYQPQMRLDDDALVGWEALLRWDPAGMGRIPPSVFIPLAEESGLIVSLGDWVLQRALTDRASILAGTVAVNLSAKQFANSALLDSVRSMLEQTGLPGSALELEITESAIMRDVDASIGILRGLKDLGIGIAIDDFGTGYSSLSYLKRFPIDRLKIDRSFVTDVPGNPEDVAIVKTIIGLGRSLGLRTIAEGVETAEQLRFLAENGCDEYQGYYGSKPLPPEEAAAYRR